MATVLKWIIMSALLWCGAVVAYDLPMRKLEAAVLKPAPRNAG
jgi:hypothetical protein